MRNRGADFHLDLLCLRKVGGADGAFAFQGRANEVPTLIFEIVNASMQQKAVVPNNECVLFPLHPAMVVQPLRKALEIVQQRAAFVLSPTDEALEVSRICKQGPAPGARMNAHGGMNVFELVFSEVMGFA